MQKLKQKWENSFVTKKSWFQNAISSLTNELKLKAISITGMENTAFTNFQEWGKFYPKKVIQEKLSTNKWLIDWLNTVYQINVATPL